MDFRIANTFTDSLAKLTGNEQKGAKTTAFDLQMNPAQPGLQFHKLSKTKDPNFRSVRVSQDVRIIVHQLRNSLVLCYVDHHDNAYRWAERRKLDVHPQTGAAQLVEVRETIQEITVPVYVATEAEVSCKPPLFAEMPDDELLGYGVPEEWLEEVRGADEDSLLALSDNLPSEAAEALLELAVGGTPVIQPVATAADPFDHPDAQRRFRLMTNVEELERALNYPWEKWAVFLHPAQRQVVEGDYNSAFRVAGSAGTGKTVVAIHRAVFLARANPDARVLLTTFSQTLADALRTKLKRLIYNEPRVAERVEVDAVDAVGERLYRAHFGSPEIATQEAVKSIMTDVRQDAEPNRFNLRFLLSEWESVVDAWGLDSWEAYRDIRRLGRKTRLPVGQRFILWSIFEGVKTNLRERGLVTRSELFGLTAQKLKDRRHPPYDFAVVDEAQDISVPQLRFLAALGGDSPNSLFFAGDLGQRIFQTPFSWKALGVDVRGRSQTLKINYRTSHQIRKQADLLLGPEVADVDGNVEDRRGTISAFNGEPPTIHRFESEREEAELVGVWLQECLDKGVEGKEIGVFVRSKTEFDRACAAVREAGLAYRVLDDGTASGDESVSISTMHLAKGLEFRAVAVMACDDEVIPLQERIETVADDADLEEVYNTERHLLYVACTRARDHLLITSVEPASEFLDDLEM
ncbi:MAG: UvrD-helicase domain-containing protein [Candidatus Poribacteria bacterium]|nr:UvrD-helicase domain-containing protein [Candidatus Poribacteria bacterium]MDE0505872.1 UvrD-helicase domain-containing protein [Candidatus Poribacteria bacterium]